MDPCFEIFCEFMTRIQMLNEGLTFILLMLLESLQTYEKSNLDMGPLNCLLLDFYDNQIAEIHQHCYLDLFN